MKSGEGFAIVAGAALAVFLARLLLEVREQETARDSSGGFYAYSMAVPN